MISIPLYVFLFIYFFFLLGFLAFFFVNISHLVHTGTMTFASFAATIIFLAFSGAILLATFYFIRDLDWQATLTLWDNRWIGSIFSSDFVTP